MVQISEAPNYFITRDGKVFWKRRREVKCRIISKYGYIEMPIHIDGRTKRRRIHRLLAIAYIKNPENKAEVNHKNGIKTDNRICNLEWSTRSENQKHAFKIGLNSNKGECNGRAKLNRELANQIRGMYPKNTLKELAEKFGVCISTVQRIVTNRYWINGSV